MNFYIVRKGLSSSWLSNVVTRGIHESDDYEWSAHKYEAMPMAESEAAHHHKKMQGWSHMPIVIPATQLKNY